MGRQGKSVLISGYYGFGNMGDEAILSSMIKALNRFVPELSIKVIVQKMPATPSSFTVIPVLRKDYLHLLRAMLGCDLFISGGGGLIQDVTGVSTIQYYLGMVMLAKLMGKKVMYYAQGIGPVNTDRGKWYTRWISDKADLITVRDRESKEELIRMGVKKPPIVVTADPVLALEPSPQARIDEITREESLPVGSSMKIAISIRPWKSAVDYTAIMAELADRLIELYNAEIVFIPFQISQDMEVCEKARGAMKRKAHLVRGSYTPEELLGLMGTMDLIIGMRLHSLIFGCTQNIPMIGIVYDPKVKIFSELIEIPCIPLDEVNAEGIIELVGELNEGREVLRKKLGLSSGLLREKALKTAELAGKLIEGFPARALEEA
ncbi:MAG: polysaccharide pyruvyl transferase CsaB [Candidatus Eremiobacteraeota bacterium]|nr:polysaccharide pyruvyl transferase CsaB [Candidatus Eremiobacteraeota bacterium]